MKALSQTGRAGAPHVAPARLQKFIPALLIFAALPGCVHIMVEAVRWRGGDHISPFGDGANVWAAARLVLSGRLDVVLDPYFPKQFIGGVGLRAWVYPPPMLLLALPFGLPPLAWAMLAYDAISVTCLACCLRTAGFGWGLAAAILTSPAALDSVADSQNGALVAGLLIAGLWRAEAAPWLGGVFLGLATIKPQLGILVPIFLLARGNWRAILAAALTAGVMGLVSALAFGTESWVSFIAKGLPFQASGLVYLTTNPWPGPQAMLMTVFSLAREMGGGVTAAYAVQGIFTLAACIGAWLCGRRVEDHDQRLAILLLLSVLAPPYLWSYDMIPLSAAVAILTRAGLQRGFARGAFLVLSLLWLTPGIAIYFAAEKLPSFCPLLVVAVLAYAWRHARGPAS
jgi:hypothetical protein